MEHGFLCMENMLGKQKIYSQTPNKIVDKCFCMMYNVKHKGDDPHRKERNRGMTYTVEDLQSMGYKGIRVDRITGQTIESSDVLETIVYYINKEPESIWFLTDCVRHAYMIYYEPIGGRKKKSTLTNMPDEYAEKPFSLSEIISPPLDIDGFGEIYPCVLQRVKEKKSSFAKRTQIGSKKPNRAEHSNIYYAPNPHDRRDE